MNILEKIVTPAFITFQAHCWFAYALVFTFPHAFPWVLAGAAVKEFYVDKHFEVGQSFKDNLGDWLGYAAGALLALVMWKHFR